MVTGQLMAAPGTELVSRANSAEAITTIGAESVIALRTEVKIALHMRGTSWTTRNFRLTKQEVKNRANAARHNKADHHPES
jgi:hypothetical protein